MKNRQNPSNITAQPKLQKRNLKHRVSFNDVIRMRFLVQSAEYLGVYKENQRIKG